MKSRSFDSQYKKERFRILITIFHVSSPFIQVVFSTPGQAIAWMSFVSQVFF